MNSIPIYQAQHIEHLNPLCTALRMGMRTLRHGMHYIVKSNLQGHTLKEADQAIRHFANDMLALSHTSLYMLSKEPISQTQPYLVMSNHRSLMDIPAMLLAFPGQLRMVAKSELAFVPFFGRAMQKAGFVFVNRQKRAQAFQQLEQAQTLLQHCISVWMAPEGTRNRTQEPLLSFKKGGFYVAKNLGIPILPAWISNANKVIPSDSLRVQPNQTIQVVFGEPISTTHQTIDGLITQTRQAMLMLSERT